MKERLDTCWLSRSKSRALLSVLQSVLFVCVLGAIGCGAPVTARAGGLADAFIDPQDGMFDTSEWLLTRKGFLPVPILITEPAVGYGAGAALLFFHDSDKGASTSSQKNAASAESAEPKAKRHTPGLPPSISAVAGGYTENETWFAAGGHFGSWRQDSIRYVGALVRPSLNLKFYGTSGEPEVDDGIEYNLQGWLLLQQVLFRMGATDLFVGGRFTYFTSQSTFNFNQPILGVEQWELDTDNLGLGLVLKYDSRDNIFTPNKGLDLNLSSMAFAGEGVFDYEYNRLDGATHAYWEWVPHRFVFGWRVDGRFTFGDAPFYALPFISLRGIPVMRYQGQHALMTEVEARYNVTPRWSLVGFAGVGATAPAIRDFSDSKDRWAGGGGFRYLTARKLGMYAGVDVARGPEEWALYLQVGGAWNR
jgi:hypothetical protein